MSSQEAYIWRGEWSKLFQMFYTILANRVRKKTIPCCHTKRTALESRRIFKYTIGPMAVQPVAFSRE